MSENVHTIDMMDGLGDTIIELSMVKKNANYWNISARSKKGRNQISKDQKQVAREAEKATNSL